MTICSCIDFFFAVGKDLTWYAKSTEDEKAQAKANEMAKIKEAEAEAMAVAL